MCVIIDTEYSLNFYVSCIPFFVFDKIFSFLVYTKNVFCGIMKWYIEKEFYSNNTCFGKETAENVR